MSSGHGPVQFRLRDRWNWQGNLVHVVVRRTARCLSNATERARLGGNVRHSCEAKGQQAASECHPTEENVVKARKGKEQETLIRLKSSRDQSSKDARPCRWTSPTVYEDCISTSMSVLPFRPEKQSER